VSRILVTGGTGFVGRHLVERLVTDGHFVRCPVRSPDRATGMLPPKAEIVAGGSIDERTNWDGMLEGIDVVMHLAARAHVLEERSSDPLAAFVAVNTDGTLNLARSAAAQGVRRFVFVSSIKVNGESTGARPFTAHDEPDPVDDYGVSKQRAESGLADVATATRLQTVIVRPPLTYGPGVGANFQRLLRLIDRELPLPLGAVKNARSLVSVWNLVDLLDRCIDSPAAANRTFMVSDGCDLSTADLIRQLATALGRRARVFAVPPALLEIGARLTGQMAQYTRLCASLRVDMGETMRTLGWRPPCSLEESIVRTARWYRDESPSARA
jgi:nucleoside-diphosphate-sugar epimerase